MAVKVAARKQKGETLPLSPYTWHLTCAQHVTAALQKSMPNIFDRPTFRALSGKRTDGPCQERMVGFQNSVQKDKHQRGIAQQPVVGRLVA